ncbi:RIC8B.2 family protein [Megaselia abdita]
MQREELIELGGSDLLNIKEILSKFNTNFSSCFDLSILGNQWEDLWSIFFTLLKDPSKILVFSEILSCVRILTRDKEKIVNCVSQDDFETLSVLANLGVNKRQGHEEAHTQVTIEALKCLCNVIFLSPQCRKYCMKNNTVAEGILQRIKFANPENHEISLHDTKLLFLITALEPHSRTKIRDDLNGMVYLTEWLNNKLSVYCGAKELELICEILKLMFNITANPDKTPDGNENEIQYRHITFIVRNLIYKFGELKNPSEKAVIMHSINLLSNISTVCITELINRPESSHVLEDIYEGKCIGVLKVIMNYLRIMLLENPSSREGISPILTVLVKCARSNRVMRHYIRLVVLPPLKRNDVLQRPEIGDELRNHLCRFLTSPDTTLRDLSADLLFVCCKENVNRMIKYTGFGNAAGLLAGKGMLDCRRVENTDYSSDSEDSDTEEYKHVQSEINPVLGCREVAKPNPLDSMSDEQKEYESEQLLKLMHQLQQTGIFQPARIGPDGTPIPVEHLLELQEELPQQQFQQKRKS